MTKERPKRHRKSLNLTLAPDIVEQLKIIADNERLSISRLIEREMDKLIVRYIQEQKAKSYTIATATGIGGDAIIPLDKDKERD